MSATVNVYNTVYITKYFTSVRMSAGIPVDISIPQSNLNNPNADKRN